MPDRNRTNDVVRLETLHADLERRSAELAVHRSPVEMSRKVVERALEDGGTYYGINTGFGALASQRISDSELADLQHNLLLSHAVGMGPLVPREITFLMLQLNRRIIYRSTRPALGREFLDNRFDLASSRGRIGTTFLVAIRCHVMVEPRRRASFTLVVFVLSITTGS